MVARLGDLFKQGKVGFTIYSPDTIRGQLMGNLDQRIQQMTGFQSGYRHWIRHDVASVSRFYGAEPREESATKSIYDYDNIPVENLQYGHLVVKLFITGPCLLTMWHGDNVIETLLRLKGKTQPTQAAPDSIRGSFWCDNGVANLTHCSDDVAEAERELKALGLGYLLDAAATKSALIQANPAPQAHITHSGILTLCRLVNRLLMTQEKAQLIALDLPESGIATESNAVLTMRLREAAANTHDSALADFIHAYLEGDLIAVTGAMASMPLTWWEHFIIQCGVITRYTWHESVSS